jgi:plastocyanin
MEASAGMNRLNRRRFLALSSAGVASAVLVACGNETPSAEELNPTQIPDVAGAPPTLAPITSTPQSGGGGQEAAPEEEQSGGGESAGGGSASVAVEAGDMFFEPSEFSVAPGGTIVLNNAGMLEHNLAVDEWGGEVIPVLASGENGEYTVPEDAAVGDSYEFYCSVPGHKEAGMVGTLTVAEAGAGGGEAEATPEEEAAAAGGGASTVDVEAGDLFFEPKEISIAPGGTINMVNAGMLEHDFAVDEWGGVVIGPLNGGEEGSYTVPEDATPGDSFEYYCSIPGHKEAGMVGTLTIAEAGGGEGAATAAATPQEEASPEGLVISSTSRPSVRSHRAAR